MTLRPRAAWGAGILAAVALLALFSGPLPPSVPFTGELAPESPFLKERYLAPFTDDFAAVERMAGAISASGHHEEAIRLRQAWQRVLFKRFLQEPHARPATVGDAIRSESRETETIRAMAERTLKRVSVRWLPDDNDTLAVRTLKRVEVSNGLPIALTRVAIAIPSEGGTRSVALTCGPATPTSVEDGVPLPPGESAVFLCPDAPSSSGTGLSGGVGSPPLLSYVQARPYFLSLGGAGLIGESRHAYYGVADFELSGCAARLTCDEVRARQLEELRSRVPQIIFVLAMLSLAGVMWLATRPLRARVPQEPSRAATFATGFAMVMSVFQLLVVYFLLNPRVGYTTIFLTSYLIAVGALQAAATLFLSVVLAWKRAQVTRIRIFALGLSILALAMFWFARFGWAA